MWWSIVLSSKCPRWRKTHMQSVSLMSQDHIFSMVIVTSASNRRWAGGCTEVSVGHNTLSVPTSKTTTFQSQPNSHDGATVFSSNCCFRGMQSTAKSTRWRYRIAYFLFLACITHTHTHTHIFCTCFVCFNLNISTCCKLRL